MDASMTPPTDLDCVVYDEADDIGALLDRPMGRRRGLAMITGAATALVGGLTSACGVLAPIPCTLGEPDCCHLATCIECEWAGTKDLYTCPTGYQQSYWTCIDELNNTVVCGECTPGTSCFQGPFACSIWY